MISQAENEARAAPPAEAGPQTASSDNATAAQLFTEHAPRVYRLVRWLVGDEVDAEDVTQKVFLQVIRKWHTFRGGSAVSTWLNRVAVREALAFRKQRAGRRRHEVSEPDEEFAEDGSHQPLVRRWRTPLAEVLDRELHEQIEGAIARLPEPYRDVFVLADVEGMGNQEVADLLALSVAAVKSRLHRARRLMRRALTPYFAEQPA